MQLLSEGSIYFFGKPADISKGLDEVQVIKRQLSDTVSSKHGLALSPATAVKTTALVLAVGVQTSFSTCNMVKYIIQRGGIQQLYRATEDQLN